MPIFDAHAHIGSWPNVEESKNNLLFALDRHYIEGCLLSDADCSSFPAEHTGVSRVLSALDGLYETLDFAKKQQGRIYIGVWFKPLCEPTPSPELVRLIQDNRSYIKTLKFHPFCERLCPNDERMEPYYELARELDLPILIHTALDVYSNIACLVEAAKKHPDLRFVAAHLELGSDHEYATNAIKDIPNIVADTAWVDFASAKRALQLLGEERVMFGSDTPIDGAYTLDNPLYMDFFENRMGIAFELWNKLMYENAISFYRIKD